MTLAAIIVTTTTYFLLLSPTIRLAFSHSGIVVDLFGVSPSFATPTRSFVIVGSSAQRS